MQRGKQRLEERCISFEYEGRRGVKGKVRGRRKKKKEGNRSQKRTGNEVNGMLRGKGIESELKEKVKGRYWFDYCKCENRNCVERVVLHINNY